MLREILIRNNMSKEEADLTIAHELVHIAAPFASNSRKPNPEMEEVIDEIALKYAIDPQFMGYVRGKLPFFCRILDREIKFPWEIAIGKAAIEYID